MAVKQIQPNGSAVNFGDLDMYSGGAFVPDGDYILKSLDVLMFAGKDGGRAPRLGVMVTFLPLLDPRDEVAMTQFYSMGTKADQSFAPNPQTGKGIVAIPGASVGSLNDKTNWFLFLKSLFDSGLPPGIFSNDTTVLEGTWVHITNVDEPAERSTFGSVTSEVQGEVRKANKVAIVTEIKDDGKPWEGTGGIPAHGVTQGTTLPSKPAATKKAAAPVQQTKPAGPPVDNEDVRAAAINAISSALQIKPAGLPRMALRTETFKVVKKAVGEDMASAVVTTFFEPAGEAALANLLGELGYAVNGALVQPAV